MNAGVFVVVALLLKVAASFSDINDVEIDRDNLEDVEYRINLLNDFRKTGITGGENVTIDKIKYIGIVRHKKYNYTLGSAIIINTKWVLTAALNVHGVEPEDLQVRVGSTYDDHEGLLFDIDKYHVHDKYNFSYSNIDFNIAVVKLKKELKYSNKIRPIAFASKLPKDGENTEISGYGYATYSPGGYLVKATVPYLDYKKCATHFYSITVSPYNVCTIKENVGPCAFDWGSPLVYKNKLIGVFASAFECGGTDFPPVYMNVIKFKNWIKQAIKQ